MFWISIRYKSYSAIKPHKQSNTPSAQFEKGRAHNCF